MKSKPIAVLVLCTGNSCRSILAEALLNDLGHGRVVAYSAGSHPAGALNPAAITKLKNEGHSLSGLNSKSWDQFRGDQAPMIDIVITTCDSVTRKSCPVWNGAPITVHWGIPDPADATNDEVDAAFKLAYRQLKARIQQMLELPLESFDTRHWKDALQRIHEAAQIKEAHDVPKH